jgi:SAM-dependent methyltransferase
VIADDEAAAAAARDALTAAYEGLEATFPDRATLNAYRARMLARSAEQAKLISGLLQHGSVFEIGCGNGRLLIELARRGGLRLGVGIDTAHSRIEFARKWAQELLLDALNFEQADVLDYEPPDRTYDAIVCITGTFAYFEPLIGTAATALLRRWAGALRPGGLLVLELYPHPELVRLLAVASDRLRLWQELEAGDPWRFYLSELWLDDGILVHEKTFIHRTTGEIDAGRRERLMLYTQQQITGLLADAGLTEIVCRDGWTDRPYCGSETMVVTARTRCDT